MFALLGAIFGGIFRICPEILKWLDKKDERKHELSLQDKALEVEKLRGTQKLSEIPLESQAEWNKGYIDALKQAIDSQKPITTGFKWLDGVTAFLTTSVRPVVTYWFMGIYCAAKMSMFIGMVNAGASYVEAMKIIWTEEDMALFSGILNFWFLNRAFEKVK